MYNENTKRKQLMYRFFFFFSSLLLFFFSFFGFSTCNFSILDSLSFKGQLQLEPSFFFSDFCHRASSLVLLYTIHVMKIEWYFIINDERGIKV